MSTYDLPRLNNFNAVASHYAGIKPMTSKVHTLEQDVRPLGDRRRKFERVKKFSDNCYAYYDGNGGDNIKFWDYGSMHKISDEMHVALAPIVWTRNADGTETLRVRNGSGQYAHMGRYSFLTRALPSAFRFDIDNGKQFIVLNHERYYLPKSNYGSFYRTTGDIAPLVDDDKYLEFTRASNGSWEIKTNSFTYTPPRMLIDKERKKKFKPAMDLYYNWLCIMAPMFRDLLVFDEYDYSDEVARELAQEKREVSRKKRDELQKYAMEQNWIEDSGYMQYHYEPDPKHALIIMEDEEHTMRMNMAWDFLISSNLFKAHESDRKLFRSQYNRWINKVCGFNIKIEAQVTTKGEK